VLVEQHRVAGVLGERVHRLVQRRLCGLQCQ